MPPFIFLSSRSPKTFGTVCDLLSFPTGLYTFLLLTRSSAVRTHVALLVYLSAFPSCVITSCHTLHSQSVLSLPPQTNTKRSAMWFICQIVFPVFPSYHYLLPAAASIFLMPRMQFCAISAPGYKVSRRSHLCLGSSTPGSFRIPPTTRPPSLGQ